MAAGWRAACRALLLDAEVREYIGWCSGGTVEIPYVIERGVEVSWGNGGRQQYRNVAMQQRKCLQEGHAFYLASMGLERADAHVAFHVPDQPGLAPAPDQVRRIQDELFEAVQRSFLNCLRNTVSL